MNLERLGITPGPWINKGRINGSSAVAADTLIARVFSRAYRDVKNEVSNAKLIAAAPEMLEALIVARKRYKTREDMATFWVIDIQDIIEKATGRTWGEVEDLLG